MIYRRKSRITSWLTSVAFAGADIKDDYLGKIKQASFSRIDILNEDHLPEMLLAGQMLKSLLSNRS